MFEKVHIGEKAPEIFNAVIEISKGSSNKYEFDENMGAMKLDRVLYSPFYYPTDYGFIPQTRSEDGDHLDALIFSTQALLPGSVVEVKTVAVLKMQDEKGIDHKIFGVVLQDPRLVHINLLEHLSKHTPKEIVHFFQTYKTLEEKDVKILGWGNRDEALEILRKAHESWKKESSLRI